jgi:hypothetical protein
LFDDFAFANIIDFSTQTAGFDMASASGAFNLALAASIEKATAYLRAVSINARMIKAITTKTIPMNFSNVNSGISDQSPYCGSCTVPRPV